MNKKIFKKNLILMIIFSFFIISLGPTVIKSNEQAKFKSDLSKSNKFNTTIENDFFCDIIVTKYWEPTEFLIFLGNGTGGFSLLENYNLSAFPLLDILTADFNNDGLLDVVVPQESVTPQSPYYFSVFLGEGHGLFGEPENYSTSYISYGLTSGDFNNDNNIDLAVSHHNSNNGDSTIDIFLGYGNGSLGPKWSLVLPKKVAENLVTADFNNDGFLDLAIVSDTNIYTTESDFLTILFGNGTGQFYIDDVYSTGASYWCIDDISNDFNLDGFNDLAVTNNHDGDIRVFYNDGNGKFTNQIDYYTGPQPKSLDTGDFNMDGFPDLVVTILNKASILINNGTGGFVYPVQYDIGYSHIFNDIGIHDFTGDNILDLVITNKEDDDITFLRGYGNGTFGERQDFYACDMPVGIACGNYNPILPPTANFTYTPTDPTITDLIHFNDTSTSDDGTIVSWLWDFGDGNTSIMQHPTHQYFFPGIYSVKLKVTDNFGLTNNVSKEVEVNNSPPSAPNISGPVKCIPKIKYKYTFMSTTPLNIDIYYYIDWGDNTVTDWIGPFASGQIVTINHTWNSKGSSYIIKSRAKDIENLTSPWSEYSVSTPRNKATIGSLFMRILEKFPLLKRLFVLI